MMSEFCSTKWLDLESRLERSERLDRLIGGSDAMLKVFVAIRRLAPSNVAVVVVGESGTGKELVAHALHEMGPNPRGPFVTFNCSNLVESLADSQLFGHVKGAFTDAREDSLGYFRAASGGTLFLDEIGELPSSLQAKLLRAVETHEIQPVGSTRTHKVDVRLVAATNRDLKAMIAAGEFRADLYYRINATSIHLPPLRERTSDIATLCAHFIKRDSPGLGRNTTAISREALEVLCAYEWPGNVRELAHALESAMLLSTSDRIDVSDLPPNLAEKMPLTTGEAEEAANGDAAPAPASELSPGVPERVAREVLHPESDLSLEGAIKRTIVRALKATSGNRRQAAQVMNVSRSTLYRMLARYGLDDSEKGPEVGHPLNQTAA